MYHLYSWSLTRKNNYLKYLPSGRSIPGYVFLKYSLLVKLLSVCTVLKSVSWKNTPRKRHLYVRLGKLPLELTVRAWFLVKTFFSKRVILKLIHSSLIIENFKIIFFFFTIYYLENVLIKIDCILYLTKTYGLNCVILRQNSRLSWCLNNNEPTVFNFNYRSKFVR